MALRCLHQSLPGRNLEGCASISELSSRLVYHVCDARSGALQESRNLAVALQAYYDGSGSPACDVRGDIITLAGYAATPAVWVEFEAEWYAVLKDARTRPACECLHMADANALPEDFGQCHGWTGRSFAGDRSPQPMFFSARYAQDCRRCSRRGRLQCRSRRLRPCLRRVPTPKGETAGSALRGPCSRRCDPATGRRP
jgi:hypothetical protein